MKGGSRGGRGEHAELVGGGNRDYDELVRQMAINLPVKDALELAHDYLLDISRYNPESGLTWTTEQQKEFVRQFNEAKNRVGWVKELYSESAARDRLIARRLGSLTLKDAAALIVLAAIVIFVLQQMFG